MELTEDQKKRYDRNLRVFGEENQKLLLQKRVVVVGVGGLGSPLSLYLTAAGVGNLILIDYDNLDLSNLNRQVLYSTKDLGKQKVHLARERLSGLNPDVNITAIDKKLTYENFKDICKDADYIIDASDNFTTKFLVNDIGLELNIPFTIAGVKEMEGQIISVIPHETACYRCVFGNIEDRKRRVNSPTKKKVVMGVLGTTCGILGTMEATEAIKGLLNLEGRLTNTLLMVDIQQMAFLKVQVTQNRNCRCAIGDNR